ncbi:Lysosomal alpha-glucosidase [Taenia solium]|eukprot:TsM_000057400 transcript=TsM_000057400 gene=TsM_000057400
MPTSSVQPTPLRILVFVVFLLHPQLCIAAVNSPACDAVPNPSRLDCHPEPMATEAECIRRNCCWSLVDRDRTIACYFPANYPTYKPGGKIVRSGCGFSLSAKRLPGAYSVPPEPIEEVQLNVDFETETRVRVRITDVNAERWEPKLELDPPDPLCPRNMKYSVAVSVNRLGFSISRVEDQGKEVVLVDSTGLMASAFVYANQFLQMAFKVSAIHGYGLGEREDSFPIDMHDWKRMVFWARDDIPRPNANLYGVHNFFLGLSPDGTAFGMFFLNSNAMEVTKQPLPSLTFRTTGGILDFFFFVGPTPNDVVAQYYQLIGHPPVPPYWALGFQLCRYGYTGVEEIRATVERNRKAGIPQDVQWLDIDYMDVYRDWTLSKKDEFKGLAEFIHTELREKYGLRTVIIVDVGIPSQAGDDYTPYQKGLTAGVFVNDSRTGKPLRGLVWPGETVYPDFTKNETFQWWYECARDFQQQFQYDGLWIDMNEPSNFVDGSNQGCDYSNQLDYPPYTPQVSGGTLFFRTICPSALHANGVPHYNLHNLYALDEAKATHRALQRIFPGKRTFILTRSSFAGAGRHTAHWSGDITSTWSEMAASIPQMINFNLFGIPFFGADICGFVDNTTEELCVRWSQLGAFYPFSRNHNTLGARLQDPAVWSAQARKAIAKALDMRYQLLPYLYTLLHGAKNHGRMVAKALAFDYPTDLATHHNARQFLLGSCLNVAPVLSEGMDFTPLYLPQGEWVEFLSLKRYRSQGKFYPVPAPLDKIPVFYKAGCILPMHPSGPINTQEARRMGIGVTAVLLNGTACGEMVWDDGETDDGEVLNVTFSVAQQKLTAKANIDRGGRDGPIGPVPLAFIQLIGITRKPLVVNLNGTQSNFTFDSKTEQLTVTKFTQPIDLKDSWNLTWDW